MPSRKTSPLLPPHVAWPLFVVMLLVMSVGTMTGMVLASRSDGGAQIIDDYYQKAVQWDDRAAARRASAGLGWTATLALDASEAAAARTLILTIKDRTGAPVGNLTGTVQAGRPHRAGVLAEHPFQATETPGTYRLTLPLDGFGLWDFEVEAHRGDERFMTTIRHEIRR